VFSVHISSEVKRGVTPGAEWPGGVHSKVLSVFYPALLGLPPGLLDKIQVWLHHKSSTFKWARPHLIKTGEGRAIFKHEGRAIFKHAVW